MAAAFTYPQVFQPISQVLLGIEGKVLISARAPTFLPCLCLVEFAPFVCHISRRPFSILFLPLYVFLLWESSGVAQVLFFVLCVGMQCGCASFLTAELRFKTLTSTYMFTSFSRERQRRALPVSRAFQQSAKYKLNRSPPFCVSLSIAFPSFRRVQHLIVPFVADITTS